MSYVSSTSLVDMERHIFATSTINDLKGPLHLGVTANLHGDTTSVTTRHRAAQQGMGLERTGEDNRTRHSKPHSSESDGHSDRSEITT
jgi:hypothetical protein